MQLRSAELNVSPNLQLAQQEEQEALLWQQHFLFFSFLIFFQIFLLPLEVANSQALAPALRPKELVASPSFLQTLNCQSILI
jgi:hypothetical protein